MDARRTALSVLIACRKDGAWSDGVLKNYIQRDGLDRREAALASRLCYGVLQNRMLLDFYIRSFLKGSKLQPVIWDILRIGVYQIVWMDKIPVSAAVNEAVEQGKRYANARAAGLINGVLRNLARSRMQLPEPPDLATRYSHPQGLVALLEAEVGREQIAPLLASHNTAPPTCLQINTLRASVEEVEEKLAASGASYTRHPWLSDCLLLTGGGSVDQLQPFRSGAVYVQDAAAKLAVMAAAPQPGMHVLDVCAAPGGKSFAAAIAMRNRGKIVSCDIHAHKLDLITRGAERLGIEMIETALQDATQKHAPWVENMDLVIADVPCSGLGVIRKKPDLRYRDLEAISKLPALQSKILQTAAEYVRPGGVLLYSTCTILQRENKAVVRQFLQTHSAFCTEELALPVPSKGGMLTLLPHVHGTDGFFICKLRRKA